MIDENDEILEFDLGPRWTLAGTIVVTGLLIYLLVGQFGEIGEFATALDEARWRWASLSLALSLAAIVLGGFRFHLVLKAAGYDVSVRRTTSVILTAWPVVLVIPSRINDLLRAAVLRNEVPAFSCLGSIVAERFIDVQTLCLIGMAGCAAMEAWKWTGVLAAVWVAAWVVAAGTVTNVDRLVELPVLGRFEEKLRALLHGFDALRSRPRYLAGVVATSAAVWGTSMGNLWLLCWIFGAEISPAAIAGLWPLALFAGMIPVTVGGMGARDGAFVGLLTMVVGSAGIAKSAVLTASFGYGLLVVMLPAALGMPFLVRWMAGRPDEEVTG